MKQTADVLVVGGGLMGCAAARSIAARGRTVLVAERNSQAGQETTARSGAIIRAHYGVPELVALAQEANLRYLKFGETVGGDAGFVPCGYAVLVDAADENTLRQNVAMHRELGATVELISGQELEEMVPGLCAHDTALVAYEPNGGYADPALTVQSFLQGALRYAARFLPDSPVIGARPMGTGWEVQLGSGHTVHCGQVVLATGNWSRAVGRHFGLDLPVTPMRAQIAVLQRSSAMRGALPVISDLINLAYYRSEGQNGMWAGSSDGADLVDYQPQPEGHEAVEHNEEADAAAVQLAQRKAAARFRGMDPADPQGVQRAFCGLYETTPDWQPIIDSFGNLHVAVGFSGHGFKLAPVIGDELACRVEGQASPFPTGIFRLARWQENQPIASKFSYRRAKFLR